MGKITRRISMALMVLLLSAQVIAQPANDLCSSATAISSFSSCVPLTGQTLLGANATAGLPVNCGSAASADVWYSFVAQSAYPTISLSNLGTGTPSITSAGVRIQLFSGICGGLTSLSCVAGTSLVTPVANPLTPGVTYYVRIYTNSAAVPAGPNFGFDICVVDPPANDLCSNPTLLTSSGSCNVLTGQTLLYATASSALPANCGNAGSADVWYSFVAQSTNPTISLSNLGTGTPSITSAGVRIQLFSGTCGVLNSMFCVAAASLVTPVASPLTIGDTYYVRVYTNSATAPSGANFNFDICVVDPPVNDLCSNAVLLTSSDTCNALTGQTLLYATASSGLTNCGNAASADVWYRFVANSAFPTISIGNAGTGTPSITSAGIRLQLFSGSCGGLTSQACVSSANLQTTATPGGTGLIIGDTYYVRVYTNSATAPSGTNFNFDICVVDPPANDECANALPLTSSLTPVFTAGTMNYSSYLAGPTVCGGTPRYDVWYSFTAQTPNPTIAITGAGAGFITPRIQLFTGACGSLNSVGCAAGSYTPTNLSIGTNYFVRVYSTSTPVPLTNAGFNISIVDGTPLNNNCAGSALVTSSTTCNPINGNVYGATNDGVSSSCGTATYDVWYRFVAQTTSTLISLNNTGIEFTDPGIEIFSGTCAGVLVSLGCTNGNTLNVSGLTTGITYMVRIFSTAATAPTSAAGGAFTLCITDPVPANDDCSNSVLLTSATTCSVVAGTLKYATADGSLPGGCGDAAAVDVWYRFVAQTEYPVITLSGIGSHLNTAGARIQLFSGTCGSFTSLACTTSPMNTISAVAGTGLAVGDTYYIRVTTNANSAGTAGSNWGFSICVTNPATPVSPRFGNSYVNLSKKNIGGVVEPGDTLEIRMTLQQSSGILLRPRYLDNVPTNTSMLLSDSIRIITNEGLTYRHYTPDAGDDAATYNGLPAAGEYNIRMNFGWGTNLRAAGIPANNTIGDTTGAAQMYFSGVKPTTGGNLLFATSFRVVVTGSPGDIITLGGGRFVYRATAGGPDINLNATQYRILISTPMGLCSNATGVNNAGEFGGTFGTGLPLNRSGNLSNPAGTYTYVGNMGASQAIGDGTYGIIKNLSPRSSTNRDARRQPSCGTGAPPEEDCNNRMFGGYFYIDGDHTGTNNSIGNVPPPDSVESGYMLMVNADYVSSETYRQTITGLCPNTYYEFSAWIRNVCPLCGKDSAGTQTFTPGVLPNLTFVMDGVDRYSTGQVDTSGWQKKGFVFKTDPGQTSITFSIRNNAQGGGGNDWAMDDISIATCLPNMNYSPSLSPIICEGVALTINDTIRSFFDNYTYYIWQNSTDSGQNWSTITAPSSSIPVYNGSAYEYVTSYTIPPASTNLSDSGTLYRVIVATDPANLGNSSCQVTDGISIINLNVQSCVVLPVEFFSFSGRLVNHHAVLNWVTRREDQPVRFVIQRSEDGINFRDIGTLSGNQQPNAEKNYYLFSDKDIVADKSFYRIMLVEPDGKTAHSQVIRLNQSGNSQLRLHRLSNPFMQTVTFEVDVAANGTLHAELLDAQGKLVRKNTISVKGGRNMIRLTGESILSSGMYILRVRYGDQYFSKKLINTL